MRKISILFLAAAFAWSCSGGAGNVFVEAQDPVGASEIDNALWDASEEGLQAMWVSSDFAYSRSAYPLGDSPD
ncbi:MAG: hypothetical protein ACI395_03605, partial [Candidatus Cryptobacteroides sp.]